MQNGGVSKITIEDLLTFLDKRRGTQLPSDKQYQCKCHLHNLLTKIRREWVKAGRHKERYLYQQESWLNKPLEKQITWIDEPSSSASVEQSTSARDKPRVTTGGPSTSVKRGRPVKRFSELHSSRKRSLTTSLTRHTSDKLLYAAKRRVRSEGRRDLSFVLKECTASPTRPSKVRRKLQRPASVPRMFSPNEALSVFIDGRHTKRTWQFTRLSAKEQGADIYPTYNVIRATKCECYPTDVKIEPNRAEVPLQSLLNHTSQRITALQEDVIRQIAGESFQRRIVRQAFIFVMLRSHHIWPQITKF